ncbi:MAG: hypothetical protein DRH17_03605 [Deltaproteobacteria bacterium]|nr:MAG: hypothetical protein DRH17_03605 [Deltaproteobacteria bacterium]
MSDYHQEQFKAIVLVRNHLKTLSPSELARLKARIRSYLRFRKEVDQFFRHRFSKVCTQKCYQNHYSACCNREGIITFFADVVINVLMSSGNEMDRLLQVLRVPNLGPKCVYLGKNGCLWRVKPIVCEMFLCEHARRAVFDKDPRALKAWEKLKRREKRYTWPSRPILFNTLETYFIQEGYASSLMYFHNSPGLMRVKALARKKGTKEKRKRKG